MMRALIRQALIGDATLAGLGVVAPGVISGDVDTPAERPFLQLRWGQTTPGLSTVDRRVLIIWVHDKPGNYSRIDSIIRQIKVILAGLEADQHSSGWLLKTEWITDSEDLTDDGHGTITRTTTHNLVGSGN
jgi:hypothetical protein